MEIEKNSQGEKKYIYGTFKINKKTKASQFKYIVLMHFVNSPILDHLIQEKYGEILDKYNDNRTLDLLKEEEQARK